MRSTIRLLTLLLSSVLLINCAGTPYKIEPFNIYATLPAKAGVQDGKNDGIKVNVMTGEYIIIPYKEYHLIDRRAIKLLSEDYAIIMKALYTPCVMGECAHQLKLISSVFERLDAGFGATQ